MLPSWVALRPLFSILLWWFLPKVMDRAARQPHSSRPTKHDKSTQHSLRSYGMSGRKGGSWPTKKVGLDSFRKIDWVSFFQQATTTHDCSIVAKHHIPPLKRRCLGAIAAMAKRLGAHQLLQNFTIWALGKTSTRRWNVWQSALLLLSEMQWTSTSISDQLEETHENPSRR